MAWGFGDVLGTITGQARDFFESVRDEKREGGLGALLLPVDPFNRSALLTPIVTAAGVIGMLMLSGVAIGSLATTVAALLCLYFLLTQVFGYEINLAVPPTP